MEEWEWAGEVRRAGPPPGFDPADVTAAPLPGGPWRVESLALDVSGSCNLSCRYCAEAATQPRRAPMAPATLDAAWALLCGKDGPRHGDTLRFGSGEPLLARPLLERTARLAGAQRGAGPDQPALFITTNGTLLDDEACDWLAGTGWRVKVSLDGPADVHDAWRVRPDGRGTFSPVAAAVGRLARLIPQRLSVTAVLCRGTDPARVFEAAAGLGVRRIELVPVAHKDARVRPCAEDIERYQAFVFDYARRCAGGPEPRAAGGAGEDAPQGAGREGSPIGEGPPVLIRFASRVARVMGYGNPRLPCAAGRAFLGVGSDGGLFPCFRFIGLEAYRLGSLESGLDSRAQEAFCDGPGRPYEQRTPCRGCWAAPLCGGPCFAVAQMFGPGDGRPEGLACAYTLADARAAVWLVTELRRRDPERLLKFLPGSIEI